MSPILGSCPKKPESLEEVPAFGVPVRPSTDSPPRREGRLLPRQLLVARPVREWVQMHISLVKPALKEALFLRKWWGKATIDPNECPHATALDNNS